MNLFSRFLVRQTVACLLFLIGISWLPYAWHSRLAERWFAGDAELQIKLANGVEYWMRAGLDRDHFTTGSKQFDGEWLYGTYVMAALGFGQMAVHHPEDREHYLSLMEEAIGEVLSDRVRQFDIEQWKSDPLKTKERFSFVTGASLGDAILFAMLTAHPGGITEIGK